MRGTAIATGFDIQTARKIDQLVHLMSTLLPEFEDCVDSGRIQFANKTQTASSPAGVPASDVVVIGLDPNEVPDTQIQAMAWFVYSLAKTKSQIVWKSIERFPKQARGNLDVLLAAQQDWQKEFTCGTQMYH